MKCPVPDATLVSPDRAAAVAARVLDYYAQRYEQTFRMVAGDEKLADRLIVESFGGEWCAVLLRSWNLIDWRLSGRREDCGP